MFNLAPSNLKCRAFGATSVPSFYLLGLVLAVLLSLTLAQGQVYDWSNFAGKSGGPGNADGTGSAARFNYPRGIAVDASGNVYVADSVNNTIRKITSAGVVTTLAGIPESSGSADGTGSAARFDRPNGIAVDVSGNVYVGDYYNHTIRKITSAGVVTTLAGLAGSLGSVDGTNSAARFSYPNGIAVDASGNVYVADSSNHTIRKITSAGVVTTLAGAAGSSGSVDGTGSVARFAAPSGIAVDASGNVYVADSGNYTIRKITSAGVVMTLAGTAGSYGSADGTGSAARFNYPSGIAVEVSGNVYVADTLNHTIRKITSAGVVTTIGGRPGLNSYVDGLGTAAAFERPFGIAATSTGALYVADTNNNRISKGIFTTLPINAPRANITPESLTVNPGGLATFTANVVSGIAPYTYQWRRNLVKISGANKPSYILASAQQSHEGSYDCVVTNAYGSFTTSSAADSDRSGGHCGISPESVCQSGRRSAFLCQSHGHGTYAISVAQKWSGLARKNGPQLEPHHGCQLGWLV